MFRFFSKQDNNNQSSGGWSEIYSLNGLRFRYAFINRKSHIDIAIQTPKSPRGKHEDESYHLTHKLSLSTNSPLAKICFHKGKEPKTLEKAMQVLKEYVELYSIWLDTGKSIDQQIKENRN